MGIRVGTLPFRGGTEGGGEEHLALCIGEGQRARGTRHVYQPEGMMHHPPHWKCIQDCSSSTMQSLATKLAVLLKTQQQHLAMHIDSIRCMHRPSCEMTGGEKKRNPLWAQVKLPVTTRPHDHWGLMVGMDTAACWVQGPPNPNGLCTEWQ